MMSVGIRRTMIGGLALMAAATFASQWMTVPWHFFLSWGVLSGIGTGAVASVLGAAVVNRWFATRQGLVMGFLSASTTASGWLTDRYDPRRLLAIYYGFRGLSLIALPFIEFDTVSLTIFAIFYGLDWIATVPPTVRLTNESFGPVDGTIIFGWVMVAHQIGAAVAAYGAGVIREQAGITCPPS